MKKNNVTNKLLNIFLLLFIVIFIVGFNFIIKTFGTYTSIGESTMSLWENVLVIAFAISVFAIPVIITIKAMIHDKEKKLG